MWFEPTKFGLMWLNILGKAYEIDSFFYVFVYEQISFVSHISKTFQALRFLPTIPLPGRGITPPPQRKVTNKSGHAIESVTEMDIKKSKT